MGEQQYLLVIGGLIGVVNAMAAWYIGRVAKHIDRLHTRMDHHSNRLTRIETKMSLPPLGIDGK